MNAGRMAEIETVAAQLFTKGEYVPAVMLRELLDALKQEQATSERLLNDATSRIEYTHYVLSITPRRAHLLNYRDWVAAGQPESIKEAA